MSVRNPCPAFPAMDVEPMYSAEQIKVPTELPDIMKEWAKEVIRANPPNIHEFSARYVLSIVDLRRCR